jgi:hypothetical protein
VTHLLQLMLDELQRRNYSPSTVRCYIHAVKDFFEILPSLARAPGPDPYSRVPGAPVSRSQVIAIWSRIKKLGIA